MIQKKSLKTALVTYLTLGVLVGCDATPSQHNKPSEQALAVEIKDTKDTQNKDTQNKDTQNKDTTDPTPSQDNPTSGTNTGIHVQTAQKAGQEIAERLQISYARASAYTSNECPKLVEFQFSNQSITRQDEQFPTQMCDYFIYLRQGEILKIDVSNEVKAELVSPVRFNFANGHYTAPKYDKYTVRLSYDGTRFHPENFKYDVILTKAKSEATF